MVLKYILRFRQDKRLKNRGVTSAFDIGTHKMSRITLRRVIRHDDYLVQGGNKKLRCTRLWNTPKMKNENVYLKEEK